jgi:hypothetical protein
MATRLFGLFMIFPVFSVYAVQYENTTPYLIGLAIGIYKCSVKILKSNLSNLAVNTCLMLGMDSEYCACGLTFIGSVVAANSTDIIHVVIGRALQGSGAISGAVSS